MTSESFPGRAFLMPRINKNYRDNYSRKCGFYNRMTYSQFHIDQISINYQCNDF